jgi:rSAM/selenodomain-associated transferase 1
MVQPEVILFVKYPEPGRVKTRLARTVGDAEAARMYASVAEQNCRVLKALPGREVSMTVAFDPAEAEESVRHWLGADFSYTAQRGEGLGERLAHAFLSAFQRGSSKVLALGSDTLGLEASDIEQAWEALDRADVVIGPAKDGGYYLVGMGRCHTALFENIPWSTPQVFEKTLTRAQATGLSIALLRELGDLDEEPLCGIDRNL